MSSNPIETLVAEALEEVTGAEKARVENPRIRAFGCANPVPRLTQEETFRMLGYNSQRILKIFLNSGIDFRRFYLDPENFNRFENLAQTCIGFFGFFGNLYPAYARGEGYLAARQGRQSRH